jgi:hypothetical protein
LILNQLKVLQVDFTVPKVTLCACHYQRKEAKDFEISWNGGSEVVQLVARQMQN